MCGIVGVLGPEAVEERLVVAMRDRLVHRGPDADGIWSSPDHRVCLGHRRLTIIDPSPEANQPFVSEEKRLAIVLNGEIYNFRAIGRELEREGVLFRTRSDTEVLLEAYRRWEEDCLERLSGMFAFAIWDAARHRLFCARDRAGEKPFHYVATDGWFAFASELKALLPWPKAPREIDWSAVADFLTLGYIPDPKTVWMGVKKLPPAHWLSVELGEDGARSAEPVPYWDFELEPDPTVEDWGERIRATLQGASEEMTVADVPVGTFLSGGVDSSSVTAALAHAGRPLTAYTVGFEEEAYDERGWASRVAERYDVENVQRTVVPGDVEAVFRDTILWHYDEPFNDYSYLPTYYVCREARRSITVALSGDGGDEIFGGYNKYAMLARRAEIERGLTRPVTQLVATGAHGILPASRLRDRMGRYRKSPDDLLLSTLVLAAAPERLRRAARGPLREALRDYDPRDAVRHHLDKAPPADVGLVDAMRYLDVKTTLGAGILTKVDRASMAVSLEVRPVYLHRDMLDLARRIPGKLLANGNEAKLVLKDAMRPWLPEENLTRPKMGFAMPLREWLRGDLAFDRADERRRPLSGILDPAFVAETRSEHAAGADRTATLHALTFLDFWLERWT